MAITFNPRDRRTRVSVRVTGKWSEVEQIISAAEKQNLSVDGLLVYPPPGSCGALPPKEEPGARPGRSSMRKRRKAA
jgi:hypothetical protein